MRAVVLAGGQGTRLDPYTTVVPKPLLPVGERPILEVIIRQLASSGFDVLDLCVGHLGGLIKAYLEQGPRRPEEIELRYHWEEQPLGTAGALRQIDPPDEAFLVMNGDILTALDLAELMRFHVERNPSVTIVTYCLEVRLPLGVVESNAGAVTGYTEKPALGYDASTGIYVLDPAALDYIPEERFSELPELVRTLLDADEHVVSYRHDGPWFDIGTPESRAEAVAAYMADPHRFDP